MAADDEAQCARRGACTWNGFLARDRPRLGERGVALQKSRLVQESFGFAGERDTLARAKQEMETIEQRTGRSCQDVFITASGAPGEQVVGWLTDKRIERYALLGD